MRRTTIFLAAALFCCAAFAETAKPNFSGTWRLDNGKSSQDGPPDRVYVETIAQNSKNITVTTKADGVHNVLDGEFPITEKFRIAKEGDAYRSIRAYWEGGTLVFELADKDGKKDESKVLFYVRESWTLSPDGKVLTRFRRTMNAGKATGERRTLVDQKYVFDRQ